MSAVLIIVLVSFMIPRSKAQAFSLGLPFGGKITSVLPCTCPADLGWQITVGPPRPGVYMYQPGFSMLFMNYNIFRPGAWVVGIATTYVPCLQISITGCIPVSTGGLLIRLIGTSL